MGWYALPLLPLRKESHRATPHGAIPTQLTPSIQSARSLSEVLGPTTPVVGMGCQWACASVVGSSRFVALAGGCQWVNKSVCVLSL